MMLDYDSTHYVFSISKGVGLNAEGAFIGVNKIDGGITRFYPNADIDAFNDAVENKQISIVNDKY